MMSDLIFQDRVRKHEIAKRDEKQSQILKIQRLMGVIIHTIEPLCAGLAGTWVINSSNDVALNLMTDKTFQSLSRSNIFNNAMRSMSFNNAFHVVQYRTAFQGVFGRFKCGSGQCLQDVFVLRQYKCQQLYQ